MPAVAVEWSKGKLLFASGSPFPAQEFEGKVVYASQCNNMFIFPGVGMGAKLAKCKTITDSMLLAAAFVVADFVNADDLKAGKEEVQPGEGLQTGGLETGVATGEGLETGVATGEGLETVVATGKGLETGVATGGARDRGSYWRGSRQRRVATLCHTHLFGPFPGVLIYFTAEQTERIGLTTTEARGAEPSAKVTEQIGLTRRKLPCPSTGGWSVVPGPQLSAAHWQVDHQGGVGRGGQGGCGGGAPSGQRASRHQGHLLRPGLLGNQLSHPDSERRSKRLLETFVARGRCRVSYHPTRQPRRGCQARLPVG
eukprot:1192914-Prorocentrum_minimum.AAC.2